MPLFYKKKKQVKDEDKSVQAQDSLKEVFGEKYSQIITHVQKLISDSRILAESMKEKSKQLLAAQKEIAEITCLYREEKEKADLLQEEVIKVGRLLRGKDDYIKELEKEKNILASRAREAKMCMQKEELARQNAEKELDEQMKSTHQLRQETQKWKQHWQESEWYLHEERQRIKNMEKRLQNFLH